jgi:hypothetical protein
MKLPPVAPTDRAYERDLKVGVRRLLVERHPSALGQVSARVGAVHRAAGVLWALSLVAFVGCSPAASDRVPVYPVEGTVSFGGKPIEGALIVLHPQAGSDPKVLPARGQVDSAGKFTLTTYEAGDGAAAGEYSVTVVHTPLVTVAGDAVAGPNVLPRKYATPTDTDLKVSITAGPNTLPALELKP